MSSVVRRTVLVLASFLLAAAVLAPSLASAQYREFTGRIDKISKGKKMIVDNRQGDKVSFIFVKETEVTGLKDDVKQLKRKDWVTVSWKFTDKPRKAYKVLVIPEKKEAGEEVE
jgi:hypothetical protein